MGIIEKHKNLILKFFPKKKNNHRIDLKKIIIRFSAFLNCFGAYILSIYLIGFFFYDLMINLTGFYSLRWILVIIVFFYIGNLSWFHFKYFKFEKNLKNKKFAQTIYIILFIWFIINLLFIIYLIFFIIK